MTTNDNDYYRHRYRYGVVWVFIIPKCLSFRYPTLLPTLLYTLTGFALFVVSVR